MDGPFSGEASSKMPGNSARLALVRANMDPSPARTVQIAWVVASRLTNRGRDAAVTFRQKIHSQRASFSPSIPGGPLSQRTGGWCVNMADGVRRQVAAICAGRGECYLPIGPSQ